MADAVSSDLLTKEPYRTYGIDEATFFSRGTNHTWSDLVGLSDRTWGWEDDYRRLLAVSVEAIRAHPWAYTRAVTRSLRDEFIIPYQLPAPQRASAAGAPVPSTVAVEPVEPPLPPPGELISQSRLWWLASTPDSSIWYDWSSRANFTAPPIQFADPRQAQHYDRIYAKYWPMLNMLPPRDGSSFVAGKLNAISLLYPNMFVCLLVGALGFAVRRPRPICLLFFLTALALTLVVGTALGEPATLEYRMPVDPVFVLFGLVGVLGAGKGAAWYRATSE